jgi:hypothetical protein
VTTPDPVTSTGLSGSFEYSHATDSLVWSEAVFAIHGFAPGEVLPTLDLVLAHKHPDDRPQAARVIREVCTTGRPFSLWHRLVDANGSPRDVLSVGAGVLDENGAVVGVVGYLTDLTDAVRRTAAREVEQAIDGIAASRADIEQVKGALMLTYTLDADAAFALMRRYSQLMNVKVRDLARDFVRAMAVSGFPAGTRHMWDRLVAGLADLSTTDEVSEQAAE